MTDSERIDALAVAVAQVRQAIVEMADAIAAHVDELGVRKKRPRKTARKPH